MAKFSLGKPDEAKFQSFISFLNSDGQGYLLESELETCLTKAFNVLNAESNAAW